MGVAPTVALLMGSEEETRRRAENRKARLGLFPCSMVAPAAENVRMLKPPALSCQSTRFQNLIRSQKKPIGTNVCFILIYRIKTLGNQSKPYVNQRGIGLD